MLQSELTSVDGKAMESTYTQTHIHARVESGTSQFGWAEGSALINATAILRKLEHCRTGPMAMQGRGLAEARPRLAR